jgi:hypothetical protein
MNISKEQNMTICYGARRGWKWNEELPMPGLFGFLRMLRGVCRLSAAAGRSLFLPFWILPCWILPFLILPLLIVTWAGAAEAFDYARYQAADLDSLAARRPPLGLGVDVPAMRSVRLDVTLASPATSCPTKVLKWAMRTSGIAKDAIQGTPISHCIKVKSAKGRWYPMFIQDVLGDGLAKEAQPGGKLTLYGSLVYFAQRGPGIVVNEFSAQPATPPKPHSGVDLTSTKKK